jgi:hypothetical protein
MTKGKGLKTLAKKFISNNLDLMFNIEKIVRHVWYMKSKQNSSRISLTKNLGSHDCKSNIHNPNLSCDIASMKSNNEFPNPNSHMFSCTSKLIIYNQNGAIKMKTFLCKQ